MGKKNWQIQLFRIMFSETAEQKTGEQHSDHVWRRVAPRPIWNLQAALGKVCNTADLCCVAQPMRPNTGQILQIKGQTKKRTGQPHMLSL